MKLKETLNLGKTAFPMRAGLPTKEPVWQKEWEDAKLYQRRQELNEGKPHFVLHKSYSSDRRLKNPLSVEYS